MKETLRHLEAAVAALGFAKYALVDWAGARGIRAVHHNAPGAWADVHDDLERNPAAQRILSTPLPFAWDRDLFVAEDAEAMWQRQAAHGFRSGLCASYGAQDVRACIILTGQAVSLQSRDAYLPSLSLLTLLAGSCHSALERFAEPAPLVKPIRLRPRELECLHWALMGKTAWETGIILKISERTVVQHLNRAREQLEAPNKKVAVDRARELALLPLQNAA